MIRYTKQRTEKDCGPTAIANALKWAGCSFSYADTCKDLIENCYAQNGAHWISLNEELRRWKDEGVFREVKLVKDPSLDMVKRYLSKGWSIIIDHARKTESRGHYVFVERFESSSRFLVVNEFAEVDVSILMPGKAFAENVMYFDNPKSRYSNGSCWFLKRR